MEEYSKAWVALIGAILVIIDQTMGIKLGFLSEEQITIAISILTAVLVWAIPNRTPEQRRL